MPKKTKQGFPFFSESPILFIERWVLGSDLTGYKEPILQSLPLLLLLLDGLAEHRKSDIYLFEAEP